ncbi:MAG TPA: GNAT family N-acetyltransferase [Candidatus Binataceae bacterium]|jgi:GNAT superfamily N-acetyltransferase|nr:GNAT family N-acetyltransferase [Candidatus Binataceae bacterium]
MGLSIRFATVQDAEQVVHFIRELAAYEREPEAVEVTPGILRAQMESADPPFECLLAELDGAAVGFALFFRNYSTWRGRPGLFLEDLFVPQRHRRKGIGSALLGRLAAISVERGYGRMEWSVLNWNKPAQDFYRKMGATPMDEWTIWRLSADALGQAARG